jgi:hypothetical protein
MSRVRTGETINVGLSLVACDGKGSGVVFGQRPTTWNILSPKTTPDPLRIVVGTLRVPLTADGTRSVPATICGADN